MADAGDDEGARTPAAAGFVCAVCHDAPDDAARIASVVGCGHRFCGDCLGRWVDIRRACPLCNAPIDAIASAAGATTAVRAPDRSGAAADEVVVVALAGLFEHFATINRLGVELREEVTRPSAGVVAVREAQRRYRTEMERIRLQIEEISRG